MITEQNRNKENTPIHSTYTQAPGATPAVIELFVTPVGGAVGKQTTNLPRAQQIGAGEFFEMHALRVAPVGMGTADLIALQQNYVLQFIHNGVPKLEAPIDFWASGAGIAGTPAAADAAALTNGTPDPRAIAVLDPLIFIDGGEQFKVRLEGTSFNAAAAVFFRVYLDGVWHKLR